MQGTIVVILLLVIAIATILFIPRFLMQGAISQVIKIMRRADATSPATAKTREELNLQQKGILQKMGRRDYKPYALVELMKIGIILSTDDGRVYLSEAALLNSSLKY